MTSVGSTGSIGAEGTLTGAIAGSQTLGKQDFLNLLVAQLQNQDPLKPLDDKEFVAQLAQFSALEQGMETNQRLALLQSTEASLNNNQVAGLIGSSIEASGDKVALTDVRPAAMGFTLGGDAAQVTMTVRDASGKAVRTLTMPATKEGSHAVAWDGLNDAGQPQANGTYTIEVAAKDAAGATVASSTQVSGVVTQVSFESGTPELIIGASGQRVTPADVISISRN